MPWNLMFYWPYDINMSETTMNRYSLTLSKNQETVSSLLL